MVKKNTFNKKRYIIIGICIVLLFGTWFIYTQTVKIRDRQRFKEAETVKNQIIEQLADQLGDNVKEVSEHNECFNTEQGPYDNGKLWCQAMGTMPLHEVVSYKDVGNIFLGVKSDVIAERTTVSNSRPTQQYGIMLENGIVCNLVFQTSENKKYGTVMSSRHIPEDSVSLSVACSDRAKAKHYPYTE